MLSDICVIIERFENGVSNCYRQVIPYRSGPPRNTIDSTEIPRDNAGLLAGAQPQDERTTNLNKRHI
jgi:hypothetical protein